MYPPLVGPFANATKLHDVPATTLACAMEIMGVRMGNVQLASWGLGAHLTIAAQTGFGDDFLNAFRSVSLRDTCACGHRLRSLANYCRHLSRQLLDAGTKQICLAGRRPIF
jgi:hypothetical protein